MEASIDQSHTVNESKYLCMHQVYVMAYKKGDCDLECERNKMQKHIIKNNARKERKISMVHKIKNKKPTKL